MSRHIKLEIFDDAERCSDGYESRCRHLSWDNDGCRREWFWCSALGYELKRADDAFRTPLRCPECKAAEVTDD